MRVLLPAFGLGKTGRPYTTGGLGFFEVFGAGAVAVAEALQVTDVEVDALTVADIEQILSTVDLTQDLTVADAVSTAATTLTLTPDVTKHVSMIMIAEQSIVSDMPTAETAVTATVSGDVVLTPTVLTGADTTAAAVTGSSMTIETDLSGA